MIVSFTCRICFCCFHHYSWCQTTGGVQMEAALGTATSLLGKVFTKLSDVLVAPYVDSLELGQNSEQIKAKLLHTKGLLQVAQWRDMTSVSALKEMLEELSRQADKAEDLLDEIHYFKIHDRLHGTSYATTQGEGGTF